MAKTLRVVVPPHPLIRHWLTILRDRRTPGPLYATALEELGHWLTYEAMRDWLPHTPQMVEAGGESWAGEVIDASAPLLTVQLVRGGQELWFGARRVVPQSRQAHLMPTSPGDAAALAAQLPAGISDREGVLVLLPSVDDGHLLDTLLGCLRQRGVEGRRLRVVTALAAQPGLHRLAETWPDLTIYTACIDASLDASGRPRPGIGDPPARLYGWSWPGDPGQGSLG
jgi:uracil phosphoribosyltransferase